MNKTTPFSPKYIVKKISCKDKVLYKNNLFIFLSFEEIITCSQETDLWPQGHTNYDDHIKLISFTK